ncbi:MAG: hypothetical protein V3V15_03535 [Sphingorhabdus sp.]
MTGDEILLIATGLAVLILILLIIMIRVGVKGSRERDFLAPAAAEELAAGEAGIRMAVLPERENMELASTERVVDPAAPVKGMDTMPRQSVLGDNEIESGYSADQLMQREVMAMLLQDHTDRAVKHVMKVKRVKKAKAEAIVSGLAES